MPLVCFIALYEASGVGCHTRSRQIKGRGDETFFAAKPSQYVICVPLHKVILTFFYAHDKSTLRPFEGILHVFEDLPMTPSGFRENALGTLKNSSGFLRDC